MSINRKCIKHSKSAWDLGWCRLPHFGHNLQVVTKALNGEQTCTRVLGVCHKIASTFLKAEIQVGSKSSLSTS